jgi:hypothetical protein
MILKGNEESKNTINYYNPQRKKAKNTTMGREYYSGKIIQNSVRI